MLQIISQKYSDHSMNSHFQDSYTFMNLHFPMKKNTVLLKSMDKYLLRMYDHGVIEHYLSTYFFPRGNIYSQIIFLPITDNQCSLFLELREYHSKRKEQELKPLELKKYYTIFMVAGIMYLISMIIFISEKCRKKNEELDH